MALWITTTLALQHLRTSLWELTARTHIAQLCVKRRPAMLRNEALARSVPLKRPTVRHPAVGRPMRLAASSRQAGSSRGSAALTAGCIPAGHTGAWGQSLAVRG